MSGYLSRAHKTSGNRAYCPPTLNGFLSKWKTGDDKSNMAASVRICSCLRKFANRTSCFQGFRPINSSEARIRFIFSSRGAYSVSDGIESNPFYEKYAERIKKVRDEIKEGRL